MAVVIDQIEATVEAEEQPAPPPESGAGSGKNAAEPNMLRAALARLAEREARLRAD